MPDSGTKILLPDASLETHPLEPFFPEGAWLLMCGTFPPSRKRWSMDFYYPNFINDMWRVFGLVYFDDREALVDKEHKTFRLEKIKSLLVEKGIALSDTGREVVRTKGNASDKDLDIRGTIDLAAVLARLPHLTAVATTGEKAAGVIAAITGTEAPAMGEFRECRLADSNGHERRFRHWRMPSTSRAYPLPLEQKARFYSRLLKGDE